MFKPIFLRFLFTFKIESTPAIEGKTIFEHANPRSIYAF